MASQHPVLSLRAPKRLNLQVQGIVQGIGFRPFIYRLATELGLKGWVRNSLQGAELEVEGESSQLATFLELFNTRCPPHAMLAQIETRWLPSVGYEQFNIYPSMQAEQSRSAWILPDLATCSDCLQELFDPSNRRYHYPLINCTHCGPRYSILTALPYDRSHTTMGNFRMCALCQQEYDNPTDRRFHAQPNACPNCGPHLELWNGQGQVIKLGSETDLISMVADCIRQGKIIALKGLGGFHLMVDAQNEGAVQRLRDRKHRPSNPLALMYPSVGMLQQDYLLTAAETDLLTSAAAPIVLLTPQPTPRSSLAASVAPRQSTLGVMLPYTPLHHLLLAELNFPVLATSGNRSHAPMCIDNHEAIDHLSSIADLFVVHNRPIARPMDDSVVRVMNEHPVVIRRARGYAPVPLSCPSSRDLPCLLAVGGHQKNTVALSVQGQIIVSQHLGDLSQAKTAQRFQETLAQMLQIYDAHPIAIACDAHPDYGSTHLAQALSNQHAIPLLPIQHHYAHVLSALVDQVLAPPVLGIAWDGAGYGWDGTIWGGEFLEISSHQGFERVAQVRPFLLPGGECAAREPRRSGLGMLYSAWGERAFDLDNPVLQAFQPQERQILKIQLRRQVNTPTTSSIGRLFDGVAALIGLGQHTTFEGEAAMALEAVTAGIKTNQRYPYRLVSQADRLIFDWEPMLSAILADTSALGMIAAKFHNTLIDLIVTVAKQIKIPHVVLTGGCFQNHYLVTGAMHHLRRAGLQPYTHQHLPPNDGGLSAGQILGAAWQLAQRYPGGRPCV